MSGWERKIIDAFISHFFSGAKIDDKRQTLRLRSSVFFPDFHTAHPDEKVSYLEAAELLQRKGIITLNWEKHAKGERLKTLSCENVERIFEEAGRAFPKTEAEEIRTILAAKAKTLKDAQNLKETIPSMDGETKAAAQQIIALLEFLSMHFGTREIGQGINRQTMEDFIRLLDFCSNPVRLEKLSTRALSILLYRDSKRLEDIVALCKALLSRAEKSILPLDITFLERSYPETMISGKIVMEYKNEKTPLINGGGHILGIFLENAEMIQGIQLVSAKKEKTALTIENKETFFALGSPQKHGVSENLSRYDCFLYTGGYSNRAAAAIIKVLADSQFSFYHAGDLDPDGILILQNIQDLAGRPVTPLRMDADTFDQYRAWARPLTKPMLRQIKKIRAETRAIPGLADLLRRIEETGLGVEQEIVDYR